MKDTLKLPNVLRHILANPEIPKDPMYRQQIEIAIGNDEEAWDLERTGRSWDQHCFAIFLGTVVEVSNALKDFTLGSPRIPVIDQMLEDLDKASLDLTGVPISEAKPELPEWMQLRVQEVEQWRAAYYENQKAKHLGSNS